MEHVNHTPLQNFVVTVQNEKGQQASDFLAQLPKTFKLPRGLYNVGLVEFSCIKTDSTTSLADSSSELKPSDQKTTLFTDLVDPVVTRKQYMHKKTDHLIEFQSNFNRAMIDSTVPIQIGFYFINATQAVTLLRITHTDVNTYVILPEPIAHVLGFRRRCFYLGRYMAETVINSTSLSSLNDKAVYTTEIVQFPYRGSRIFLDRKYKELVRVARADGASFEDFIKDMTNEINNYGYDLALTKLEDDKLQLEFKSVNRPDEYIILPDELATVFGFTTIRQFQVGNYISDVDVNINLFDQIPQKKLLIEMARYHSLPIFMKEPSQAADYESVLQEINESFAKAEYDDLLPRFQLADGKIFATGIPNDVIIKLPIAVNRYFGISDDAEFKNGIKFVVQSDIVNKEERLDQGEPRPRDVLVLLDVIENQVYTSRLAPILDKLRWDINSSVTLEKRSVVYLPVWAQELNFLRVTLVDGLLRNINLPPNYVTTLRLHFKPVLL